MKRNTVSATKSNNVGSTILALSGMITRTFHKNPTGKQIACQIALEKVGVIRPIADRVATGLALSPEAYKGFVKLAKTDEGATKVVKLAKELAERVKAIVAYKAGLATAETSEEAAPVTAEVPAEAAA